LFNGVAAPLLYVSSGLINTVVPFGAQGVMQVAIETAGQSVPILPLATTSAASGLFTLPSPAGQAAVLNQDGTVNSPQIPTARGSIISLFATGFGAFNPPLVDGEVAPVPASTLTLPLQVYFGSVLGSPGRVLGNIMFAGSAPGVIAGVVQINVQVPSNLPAGVDLNAVSIWVNPGTQPGVTVALK
jgi:uncharacterized protein (TIGR03437 family)